MGQIGAVLMELRKRNSETQNLFITLSGQGLQCCFGEVKKGIAGYAMLIHSVSESRPIYEYPFENLRKKLLSGENIYRRI